MSLRLAAAACLASSLACGGPPAPAPVLVTTPVTVTAPPPKAQRGPSAALLQRFAVSVEPNVRVYVDADALGKSEILRAIVAEVEKAAGTALGANQRSCLTGVLTGARELVVGVNADERGYLLALLRFDPATFDPQTCLEATGVARYDAAHPADGWNVAVDGDVVIFGEGPTVERALRRDGKGSFAGLGLGGGEVAVYDGALPPRGKAHGAIEMTAERFRVGAQVTLQSEEEASRIERMVASGPRHLEDLPPQAAALAKAIHVSRSGARLDVDFTLTEPPADQARDLGTAAALGVFAVRKYLVNAKLAEVRNTVGQITKSLVASYEAESMKGPHHKLTACPPVPKTVPRGVVFQPAPADWKAWAPLRFEMSGPQRFQYEVKLDKTGKHAQVIGRGDLNGDGKTSLFRILVDVPAKDGALTISPQIEETDAEE